MPYVINCYALIDRRVKVIRKLGGYRSWLAGNYADIHKYNCIMEICQSCAANVSQNKRFDRCNLRVDFDLPGLLALYLPSNDIFDDFSGYLPFVGAQVEELRTGKTDAERESSFSTDSTRSHRCTDR